MYKVVSMGKEIVRILDTESKTNTHLLDLPEESIRYILSFCDVRGISRFSKVSVLCNKAATGSIDLETLPRILPDNFLEKLIFLKIFQTSRFLTANSKESAALMYDRDSLEYLKEKLPNILQNYDQDLVNIDDLSKESLINSVVECATQIPNQLQISHCLGDISKEVLKIGDIDKALEIAKSIPDESYRKDICFTQIAKEVLKIGDIDKALEIANLIQSNYHKDTCLLLIAEAVFKAGDVSMAVEIAKQMRCAFNRSSCLQNLAKSLAQKRQFDRSLEIINEIPIRSTRSNCIKYILRLQCQDANLQLSDVSSNSCWDYLFCLCCFCYV